MFESIHEECGVFGIYENGCADPASSAYFGLYALQHRSGRPPEVGAVHRKLL